MSRFGSLVLFALGSAVLSIAGCGGTSGGTSATDAGSGGRAGAGTGGRAAAGGSAGAPAAGSGGAVGAGGRSATGGAGGTVVPGAGGTSARDGGVTAGTLGQACAADTDCGTGVLCLKASDKLIFGQGGPAHGYCTVGCAVAADQATCTSIGGSCVDLAANTGDPPQGYCLKTCTLGDPDRVGKCQGRTEVACTGLVDAMGNATGAVCLPTCSQDVECTGGRKCDPRFGVCVDTPSAGTGMGTHCTANATTGASACAGNCLTIGSATNTVASLCSSRCVLGELSGCNWVGAGVSVAGGMHGVCALGAATAMPGDQGFCAVECNTVTDCPDQTDPMPICDIQEMAAIGHGVCSWNAGVADAGTGN